MLKSGEGSCHHASMALAEHVILHFGTWRSFSLVQCREAIQPPPSNSKLQSITSSPNVAVHETISPPTHDRKAGSRGISRLHSHVQRQWISPNRASRFGVNRSIIQSFNRSIVAIILLIIRSTVLAYENYPSHPDHRGWRQPFLKQLE